ncbi:MAG: hypothetical protein SA378_04790 [Sedimentibacter sp.]|uniref:hypothetical protein n=1 Tax=Sedimentibacter sp. TaxID=1960295 RepID=UPI0029814E46|nr:hypothetical protein [Sedimentibacter sp.]MDW5299438.1 hypothetical protein [Sedimentibacter sp.]
MKDPYVFEFLGVSENKPMLEMDKLIEKNCWNLFYLIVPVAYCDLVYTKVIQALNFSGKNSIEKPEFFHSGFYL